MNALRALPRDGRLPTLVVDQCEEVFSLCQDEDERRRFLDRLAEYSGAARLILSFRADRLAEIAGHPQFARAVEQGLYLLGAMEENDLRAAIEGPARLAGTDGRARPGRRPRAGGRTTGGRAPAAVLRPQRDVEAA